MTLTAEQHIQAITTLAPVPFMPEVVLHQATDVIARAWAECTLVGDRLPYWAFPWPGGQALARYMLDHSETVRGKRVLDFASGSGIAGIAAMKAGARKVMAVDVDPLARAATQMNAACNNIVIGDFGHIPMDRAFKGADVILAGDVCYSQAMTATIMRWLYYCVDAGVTVWLGDPARAYLPQSGLRPLAEYSIPVRRELEESDVRTAWVWDVHLPNEEN